MRHTFNHVHMMCTDVEAIISFLTEGFGVELRCRRESGGGANRSPGAELQLGNTVLYLKQVGKDWKPQDPLATVCGLQHLAFIVEDMDAAMKELIARPDTRLIREPFKSAIPGHLCAFVAGPDNLYVEIIQEHVM